jgi:hypothetical protein
MKRILLFCALAVIVGCGNKGKPVPRGIGNGEYAPPVKAAAPAAVQGAPADDEPGPSLPSPFAAGPGDLAAPPGSQNAPEAGDAGTQGNQRDIGAEVAQLVRQQGCLDLAAAATQPGGRTSIRAAAYVMATGRMTRVSVSASGQPASAIACAESRLLNATLAAPVPGAPGQFSGETIIEVVGPKPAPAAEQAAQPKQPGPGDLASKSSDYSLKGPSKVEIAPRGTSADTLSGKPIKDEQATRTSDDSIRGGTPDEQAGAP